MSLLIPLFAATFGSRLVTWLLTGRGMRGARPLASWPAAAGIGMAAVFASASVTHVVEPSRSGLVAIVPPFVPEPELAVTLTGAAELALAVGLVVPRTRRWAAAGSIALLLAMFPANVIAAGGVDHPAAPSTPLVPRALLQLAFVAWSVVALLPSRSRRPRPATHPTSG